MKAIRMAVALAAIATLGSAAPAGAPAEQGQDLMGGCHDDCHSRCAELYPNDADMANLCSWSCVASECGGADYPGRG